MGTEDGSGKEEKSNQQPRFEADLPDEDTRAKWLDGKRRDDGENVRTFVANHWTLEYDLAHAGLGHSLHTAIALAKDEARLDKQRASSTAAQHGKVVARAEESWNELNKEFGNSADAKEYLAYMVYKPLLGNVSKPVTAQHLASLLLLGAKNEFLSSIPDYIQKAITYVTGTNSAENTDGQETNNKGR